MKRVKGLTLIELLIVIAIIGILGAATTPFLSNFVLRSAFDTTVDRAISSIRKAQNFAMDGRNNETWGVCVTESKIRVYAGSCDSPTISDNFSFPDTVTVSGLNDTTFSSTRGEPSQTLSITISSTLDSATITLNSAGGLEII